MNISINNFFFSFHCDDYCTIAFCDCQLKIKKRLTKYDFSLYLYTDDEMWVGAPKPHNSIYYCQI